MSDSASLFEAKGLAGPTSGGLYEMEAHGAALRAAGHATAFGAALDEVANALRMADLLDLRRDVEKTRDLLRLLSGRLATHLRRMEESR